MHNLYLSTRLLHSFSCGLSLLLNSMHSSRAAFSSLQTQHGYFSSVVRPSIQKHIHPSRSIIILRLSIRNLCEPTLLCSYLHFLRRLARRLHVRAHVRCQRCCLRCKSRSSLAKEGCGNESPRCAGADAETYWRCWRARCWVSMRCCP